jgi:hypothetical protein
VSCLATESGPSASQHTAWARRRQLAAGAACYRVRAIMQVGVDHGGLDLMLSLAYAALLLVLISVTYLSFARRTKRK